MFGGKHPDTSSDQPSDIEKALLYALKESFLLIERMHMASLAAIGASPANFPTDELLAGGQAQDNETDNPIVQYLSALTGISSKDIAESRACPEETVPSLSGPLRLIDISPSDQRTIREQLYPVIKEQVMRCGENALDSDGLQNIRNKLAQLNERYNTNLAVEPLAGDVGETVLSINDKTCDQSFILKLHARDIDTFHGFGNISR